MQIVLTATCSGDQVSRSTDLTAITEWTGAEVSDHHPSVRGQTDNGQLTPSNVNSQATVYS